MARPRSPRSLVSDGEVTAGGQGLLDVPGHAFGPDLAMVAGEHSCLVEEMASVPALGGVIGQPAGGHARLASHLVEYLGHQVNAEPQKRPGRERLAVGALHGDGERQLRVVNRDAP